MSNDITERLNQLITAKTKTRRAFAAVMGISAVATDNYANGKRVPPTDLLTSILRAYPDISAEWLMRGEGSMYRDKRPTTNYEIYSHSHNNSHSSFAGDYNESNGTTADTDALKNELQTLKEKEKLYLLQIAELKNDKQFLQSIIKNQ